MSNSFLQLFKGPDGKIKELELADGRLSFATDTKKIYLDCDFTDSEGKTLQDRLAFGGSSGIFYANRQFDVDESSYLFELNDLDNAEEIPQKDDLILNSDGCFYRVLVINEPTIDGDGNPVPLQIIVDKLTVAGSGGGGGSGTSGGLVAKKVDGQPRYFTAAQASIPIQYCVLSNEVAASVDMQIVIRGTTVATVYRVPQSLTEPATVDLWPYVKYFNVNQTTDITLRFSDSYGNTRSINYNSYFSYVDMHINVQNTQLGNKTTSNIIVPLYPYSPATSIMAERYICYRLTRPDSAIPDEVEIADKSVANGNVYNLSILLGENSQEGSYQLDVWMKGKMNASDEEYMYSEEIHMNFIYTSPTSKTPYISVGWEEINYTARSKPGRLVYLVAYALTENSEVTVSIYKDGDSEPCFSRVERVQHDISNVLTYTFREAGIYTAKVTWNENDTVFGETANAAIVAPASGTEVPDTYTSGLQVNLSAQGRSNNEVNRDQWISNINNIVTNCELSNFNWSTNGWFNDSANDTYLHLTNGAKLTVDFAPFAINNTTTRTNDPLYNGKTIEIDFRLSNVRDTNAVIMQAASFDPETGKIFSGIICQGDKICINTAGKRNYYSPAEELAITDEERASTAGLRAYLTQDRRIHIAFDIEGYNNITTEYEGEKVKPMIYTFVDGVISGLTQYNSTDNIRDFDINAPQYLTINSNFADVDIYNIRIYDGFLTEQVIRDNYIADFSDYDTQIQLHEANDLLDNEGNISFDKVVAANNIPYLVLEDMGKTADKKGTGGWTETPNEGSHLPYHKKDFRYVKSWYVDPFDPTPDGKYQIGSPENKVDAVIYAQGTSSLAYPVKNLRYRLVNQKYKMKYSPDGGQTYANFPGVKLFTFKADYMESSLAHNTGTGNVLQALYQDADLTTPAQDYFTDRTITNNIVGSPCLIFFKEYEEEGKDPKQYKYIGRYNFNLDKGEPELFGFQSIKDTENNDYFGILLDHGFPKADCYQAVPAAEKNFKLNDKDYYYRPFTNDPQRLNAVNNYNGTSTTYDYLTLKNYKTAATILNRDSTAWTDPSEEVIALIEYAENNAVSDTQLSDLNLDRVLFENLQTNYKAKQLVASIGINQQNIDDAITSLDNALAAFVIGPMTLFSEHGTERQKPIADVMAQANLGAIYEKVSGPGSIQCWEFLNNSYNLCGFRTSWDEMADYNTYNSDDHMPFDNWRQAFESRYPEFENSDVDCDKRAFGAFVNWVASTDQSKVRDRKNQVPITPVTYAGVRYTADTPEYRLAKFKAEFEQHMDLDFTAFYYVVTEALLAIDSRAKNMMMVCFDVDNDAGTGRWFPIFYDVDTILGLNNTGTLKFQYYAEDTDTQVMNANASYYRQSGEIEVNYSTLWCNFREAFPDKIKEMYQILHRGNLNYNGLVAWYNTKQADVFQMVHTNKDHQYKYIEPLTHPTEIMKNGEMVSDIYNGTNAAQGTRSLHRDFWLNHRFTFLTSKYPDMRDTTSADIYFRAFAKPEASTIGSNWHYTFQSTSVQYANYSYSTTATAPVVKVRPGEAVDGPPIADLNANEQECFIFNLGDIFDIGDMSLKYPGEFVVRRPIKLTNLQLGNETAGYINPKLNPESVQTSLTRLPLLRTLNLTNTAMRGSISLASNQYLTEVLAKGTEINKFEFARGGSLQKLTLPAGYNSLILLYNTFNTKGDYSGNVAEQDKALQWTNLGDLRYLGIEACPNFDTKNLLLDLIRIRGRVALEAGLNTTQLNDKLLYSFRLPDVDWVLNDDNEDDVSYSATGNGAINDIPLLRYLAGVTTGFLTDYVTPVAKTKANNTYFGGQIFINNVTHPIDEYTISKKYSQLFPNLKITWLNSAHNLHGYHFNLNDDQRHQITVDENDDTITNSEIFGIDELPTLNLADYIMNHTSVPAMTQTSNGQYNQFFRGWTKIGPVHSDDEVQLRAWLDEGIEVEWDRETGEITNVINNLGTLTVEDFIGENQDFDLFPIREDVVRYYDVTFHRYKEGSQQAQNDPENDKIPVYARDPITGQYSYVTTQSVMWNTMAVLPEDEPTNMVLNDDGTTTVYPFDRYTFDAANRSITAKVDNYPIFKEAVTDALDAHDAPSPDSFFEASNVDSDIPNVNGSTIANGVCLTLKSGLLAPAITVPQTFNGKQVYQFKLPRKTEMAKLRRIYFAGSNHPLRVISSDLTSEETHNNVIVNRILEYIDLSNTNLNVISPYTFAYAPNLKLFNNTLPNTITLIQNYAFTNRETLGTGQINFDIMPTMISEIGSYAFQHQQNLGMVRLDTATSLTTIGSYAFDGCTNFTGNTDNTYNEGDCLVAIKTIGAYAFRNCINLTLYQNHTYESYGCRAITIGKFAFYNCHNLTWRADLSRIVTIDDYAFANCGTIGFASIPNTLVTLGARVFAGDVLFSGKSMQGQMLYIDNKKLAAWSTSTVGTDVVQTGVHPDSFGGLADGFSIGYFFIVYGGSEQGDPPEILDNTAVPWNGYVENGTPLYYRAYNASTGLYDYYSFTDEIPAGAEPVRYWGAEGHIGINWISFGG